MERFYGIIARYMNKYIKIEYKIKSNFIGSLEDKCSLYYVQNIIDRDIADKYFHILESKLFYKNHNSRMTVFYGNSNIFKFVRSWDDNNDECRVIQNIRHVVELFTGKKFQWVILNRYRDGNQSIGYHSDRELKDNAIIAGVSLGSSRDFKLKPIGFYPKLVPNKIKLLLDTGSLYVINAPTNKHWMHSVPKRTKVKTPRISLTFRT